MSAAGGGRRPAPLGSHDDQALRDAEEPDTADRDDDSASNPKAPGPRDPEGS